MLLCLSKRIDPLLCLLQSRRHKRLLKVMDDVFDGFETDGHADQVRSDAPFDLFFVGKLLVRCDPGMNYEGFGVADIGEVRAKFEIIDDGADFVDVASLTLGHNRSIFGWGGIDTQAFGTYNAKCKHTPSTIRHRLLRPLIVLMRFQAWI